MNSLLKQFRHICIEKSSLKSQTAERVLRLFPAHRIRIIEDKKELNTPSSSLSADTFYASKTRLVLSSFKGSFFKRCPGARPGLVCCNYFVLNLGSHCDMDCSYCYLQNFINFPYIVIYTNIEQAFEELDLITHKLPEQNIRIGTGEITDSLSLDDLTHYSCQLISYFNRHPRLNLEFKTKSDNIKNFIHQKHTGNVTVSWSLNPSYIIEKEEHGTASLKQRLKAAKTCKDKGFKVAFHIDPVIYHPEWKANYSELVRQVTMSFTPEEVHHISLGALRFAPSQKPLMRERFGMNSLIPRGEYFLSGDGKLRYDSHLREQMFQFILSRFKKTSSLWKIFLCMENKESWQASFHQLPSQMPALKKSFDPLATKKIRQIKTRA